MPLGRESTTRFECVVHSEISMRGYQFSFDKRDKRNRGGKKETVGERRRKEEEDERGCAGG